jgi:hypothetical protein
LPQPGGGRRQSFGEADDFEAIRQLIAARYLRDSACVDIDAVGADALEDRLRRFTLAGRDRKIGRQLVAEDGLFPGFDAAMRKAVAHNARERFGAQRL